MHVVVITPAAAAAGCPPLVSPHASKRTSPPANAALAPASCLLLCAPPACQVLAPAAVRAVNINPAILGMYLDHLLPEIAAPGDDHNYGSSAMNDVTALQVGGDSNGTLFE